MTHDDLDGRVAEGWGGAPGANGSHVNVVLARRGTPTAAAMLGTLTTPTPGHTPIVVVVGEDQPSYEPVWPPTIMINKATATEDRHVSLTWGAAQLGIAQGVLDAVAEGLLPAETVDETVLLVAVWVDPDAREEAAVKDANRAAARAAIADALTAHPAASVSEVVGRREQANNAYFGGS